MKSKILDISRLSKPQIDVMFSLMKQYYENVNEENFVSDLLKKQKVILLLNPEGIIKGFSTIAQGELVYNSKKIITLFSGDTVLDKDYWGHGALEMAFGRYLVQVKLQNMLTPVYWFLISKGYKTYLLMANNFSNHYPRFEKSTPMAFKEVMDIYYQNNFNEFYRPDEGRIYFNQNKSYHLKTQIADIKPEYRTNPKIAFFEKTNPEWAKGVELACVAEVTLWVPIRYVFKWLRKAFQTYGKGFTKVYSNK